METSQLIEDCEFSIGTKKFQADLILLNVHDFDVILGMDFLSRYDANVDYWRKTVAMGKLWGELVKFQGQNNLEREGKS